MPLLSGLRVIRSSVEGYGVVATRDFAAGELLAEVDGIARAADDLEDDTYALLVDDGLLYDMVDQTRWVNHSCEPNTLVEAERTLDGGAWARLVALRAIRAGEELFYDYAFPAAVAEPCLCGAATCRGFIVDPAELEQARARFGGGELR